jgi:hypothetical protein
MIDPPSQGPGGNHGHESFQFTNLSEESSTIQSKLARSTCKDQFIIKKSGLLILLNTKKKEKNQKETSFEITHDILSNLL